MKNRYNFSMFKAKNGEYIVHVTDEKTGNTYEYTDLDQVWCNLMAVTILMHLKEGRDPINITQPELELIAL